MRSPDPAAIMRPRVDWKNSTLRFQRSQRISLMDFNAGKGVRSKAGRTPFKSVRSCNFSVHFRSHELKLSLPFDLHHDEVAGMDRAECF